MKNYYKPHVVTKIQFFTFLIFSLFLTSCSVPSMMNPDSYGRNHDVFAVDFNPDDLSSINIAKMDEGNWIDMGKKSNDKSSRFNIEIEEGYLTVYSNSQKMDVPTYQTWLNYARQYLGYTVDSPYDVFETVEEGFIYEVNLTQFPLIEEETHRILMYEVK